MPLNIEVTQFPNGIGTVGDNSILNGVPSPLDLGAASSFEDFLPDSLFAQSWSVLAAAGGGPATLTRPASPNGLLNLVTVGATTGSFITADALASIVDGYAVQAGVPSWIGARLSLSDTIESELLLGFVPAATLNAPVDGVYLFKAAGSGDVNIIVANAGAATETQLVGTLMAGALPFVDVALYWDGIKASAQFPGGGGAFIPDVANLPAVGLQPSVSVVEGAAGPITSEVDYILFGGGR